MRVVVHEADSAGRRALPLLSRPAARHDDRQRQSSAAVRQPRGAAPICAAIGARGPADRAGAGRIPLRRSGDRRALDAAPQRRPPAVVDLRSAAGACRAPRARDYLRARAAAAAPSRGAAVGEVDALRGPLYERLLRPLLLAALNTEPPEGSRRARRRDRARDACAPAAQACRPLIARDGLGRGLHRSGARVHLRERGGAVRVRHAAARARASTAARVDRARFRRRRRSRSAPDDAVILAVPPWSPRRAGARASRAPTSSAPSSTRISASRRRRACRRSSAWSTARPNGCSPSRTGCRSPSARADRLLDAPREELARDDLARGRGGHGLAAGAAAAGRSCASGARPSPPRRRRTPSGPAPRHALAQPGPGRRLDRDRPAGDDRGRDPLRRSRAARARRSAQTQPHDRRRLMNDVPRSDSRDSPALERRASRPATAALLDAPAAGRPLGVRARGRRHDPGRIRAAAALSAASRSTPSWSARSRVYLRRIQGAHGGWPLFHDGAFDMSASVKAYFALKMIGDAVDAPHMRARARGDPGARRRRAAPTSSPASLLALYGAGAVARGAGDAGRDHAAAALVSVPPRQDVLLGAHRDRAAARAAGAEAAGAQPARHRHRRTVPDAAARRCGLRRQGAAPEVRRGSQFFGGIDTVLRASSRYFPKSAAPARDRQGGRLRRPSG